MACARTVAVVVPSPATSEVLEATSRTICAPMFSSGSFSSISFATVTPSLVMSGEPNFFSITTLRPLGPRVTFTASARMFTPRRMDCRDSSPCRICFAISYFSFENLQRLNSSSHSFAKAGERMGHPPELLRGEGRFAGAFQDAEDFFLTHDQEVFAVDLDFRTGILAEQNAIARLHVEGEGLALVVGLAAADGDHFSLLRLVFGAVGDDDAAPGGLSLFYTTNNDAIVQGSQLSSHSWNSFQMLGSDWIAIHVGRLGRRLCCGHGTIMNFGFVPGAGSEGRKGKVAGSSASTQIRRVLM